MPELLSASAVSLPDYLLCTAVSLVLGLLIAFSARIKNKTSTGFFLTLLLLPPIVQTVIMLVNGSIGTGIAVAGAFSLVRFRSAPGTAQEIVCIFLSVATGLATAMGSAYLLLAALFVLIICIVMVLFALLARKEEEAVSILRITIPETLNYAHAFDDLFEKYTTAHTLRSVKTTNLGSLYRLSYRITLKNEDDTQAFLDDLRCRNGNLEVSVCENETTSLTETL